VLFAGGCVNLSPFEQSVFHLYISETADNMRWNERQVSRIGYQIRREHYVAILPKILDYKYVSAWA
jgi:hypothetical protein